MFTDYIVCLFVQFFTVLPSVIELTVETLDDSQVTLKVSELLHHVGTYFLNAGVGTGQIFSVLQHFGVGNINGQDLRCEEAFSRPCRDMSHD